MTILFGSHNILVMLLLAALVFTSTFITSECRPMAHEEHDDQNLQDKSVLELSSRDEIVQLAGYGEEKLSTVLTTGTLLCYKDCLATANKPRELYPRPISGALVGAVCTGSKDKGDTWAKAVTDEYGEFIIDLPSHVHSTPNLDKECSVRILQVPKSSPCYQSSYAKEQTEIKLSSLGNGIRTYTTGPIAVISKISKNSKACVKGLEDEPEMSL